MENQPEDKSAKRVQQLGDFELKKKLGKGGMGEVFLARQISLDRIVALKTLSRQLSGKADFVTRFQREARAMAKLDHPNVVKVYAVDSFKGIHFAAIEYVDGKSLQVWLDRLGQLTIADAVHIVIVCAEALRIAHDLTLVHRDIKPDNILVTSKGVVKVADFGLAKALDEDVSMTQSGTGLGTPLYMAPEQARSAKHVDQRCDIYALGATLYHLLTGKLPFNGQTALELIMAKEKGQYPTARSIRSDIPEKLDLIIDKMMAKDPAHRYRSCAEVVRDLSSLGIHSEALSFIDGATPSGPIHGSMPGTLASMGSTMSASRPTTSTQSARKPSGTGTGAGRGQVGSSSRIWYVQFEDAKGKTTVEKHSTGRILKMIGSGTLTAKARAKASADGAYLPLSQFSEFADAIESQLARRSAAIRTEDMKSLYATVEQAERTRYRWRWLKDLGRGVMGWISLLLLLALMGIVVWLLYNFWGDITEWVAGKFGLTADPPSEVPADSSLPAE